MCREELRLLENLFDYKDFQHWGTSTLAKVHGYATKFKACLGVTDTSVCDDLYLIQGILSLSIRNLGFLS